MMITRTSTTEHESSLCATVNDMDEYIIVTMHGYVMNADLAFTHDIADALITTNFQKAIDLCGRCMGTIWRRVNGGKWEMYCQPSNRFDPGSADELLKEIFKYGN